MPTKTKTEYETVEKTIEYTECDVPSCPNTDEDKELIELAVNPKYEEKRWKEPTVVEQCDSFHEAQEMVKREKDKRKPPRGLEKALQSYSRKDFSERDYGFGYNHRCETIDAKTDASFFVCQNCLKNHFEAVPDRYNPENIKEIEAKDGRVVVEQEEKYLIPYDAVIVVGAVLSIIILFFALSLM